MSVIRSNAGGPSSVVLFKLGGSLLTLPDLSRRVHAVLGQRPAARPLLMVGGGAAADLVRAWDRLHYLGDEIAHRLAIRAMSCTAWLAASVIDGARVVECQEEIRAAWNEGQLPVLLIEPILAALEAGCADPLPPSWDVTSDSIAAWLTPRLHADELVLLKSTDLPPGGIAAAVCSGAVDRYFPNLLGALPKLTWANLRSPNPRFAHCERLVDTGEAADA